jgi:hypothetical protein
VHGGLIDVSRVIYSETVLGDYAAMDQDWVEDESLTREETLARFRALGPTPTRGPLPGGAVIVTTPQSYGGGAITVVGGSPLRVTSSGTQEMAAPTAA